MYQMHRGFTAVQAGLQTIQSSLGVLQATTAFIGLGTVAVGALSAVNLHQTLKLRKEVGKLWLEVKEGFIDLKQALKDQGSEIKELIEQIAADVDFRNHRTILVRAYGLFTQALHRLRSAMQIQDILRRNAEIDGARGMLFQALADYDNRELLSETCSAGQLRRLECSWAIEQAIIATYQLQNESTVVSDRLSHLQNKVRQDAINIIDCCETVEELDFVFPELTRIHNHDLAVLEYWQNNVDWLRSLPPSELKLLQSADFKNLEFIVNPDATADSVPPEQLLYKKVKQKSHFFSLGTQLLFLMQPTLRREREAYISEQAGLTGYRTLVPSNLQQASDLAVANLYWYFQVRDESEDESGDQELDSDVTKSDIATLTAEPSNSGNLKQDVFRRIKIIIAEQLAVDSSNVFPSTNFRRDLGADSLDAVELVMALEEEFDIEIPDEVAEQITTVKQVVDYISIKVAT